MKSSQGSRSPAPDGRVNQKRRTRQALIDAAIALRTEGHNPTLAEVAEHAMVSRATAYRYFPSVEALISETATEGGMKPLSACWQLGDDPVEGIGRAAIEMNRLLLSDEIGLHVMERSFMTVWLDAGGGDERLRPGRRLQYIEPIVDSLKDLLSPVERRQLRHALSLVLGTEAVLAARDVAGASADETLQATAWAARSLMRQALADAQHQRRRRTEERRP